MSVFIPLSKWGIEFLILTIIFFIPSIFSQFFFDCSLFVFLKSSLLLLRVVPMLILNLIPSGLLSLHPLVYNFPLLPFFESVLSPFLWDSYYPESINCLDWQWVSERKGARLRSLLVSFLLSLGNRQCMKKHTSVSTIPYLVSNSPQKQHCPSRKCLPIFKITANIS